MRHPRMGSSLNPGVSYYVGDLNKDPNFEKPFAWGLSTLAHKRLTFSIMGVLHTSPKVKGQGYLLSY